MNQSISQCTDYSDSSKPHPNSDTRSINQSSVTERAANQPIALYMTKSLVVSRSGGAQKLQSINQSSASTSIQATNHVTEVNQSINQSSVNTPLSSKTTVNVSVKMTDLDQRFDSAFERSIARYEHLFDDLKRQAAEIRAAMRRLTDELASLARSKSEDTRQSVLSLLNDFRTLRFWSGTKTRKYLGYVTIPASVIDAKSPTSYCIGYHTQLNEQDRQQLLRQLDSDFQKWRNYFDRVTDI